MKPLFYIASLALLCSCSTKAPQAEHKLIAPLPAGITADNLQDCTVPAAFTPDDFHWMGGNLMMTVYNMDLYDVEDIAQMQVGDTILYNGDSVVINTIAEDHGGIDINGGLDFNMQLLGWMLPSGEVTYPFQLTMLILGCFIQALGILCEVKAGVSMMSAEALVNYICVRWKKEFGRIKVRFDVTLVLLAVLFSIGFALRDGRSIIEGIFSAVREGTIVAALAVGHIVRWYDRVWQQLINR